MDKAKRFPLFRPLCALISIALLVSCLCFPSFSEDVSEKKAELQGKIDALNDEIKERDKLIDELEGQSAEQEKYAEELNAQIEDLQSQVDALNQKVSILQEEVDDLQAQIEQKNARITVLQGEIDEAEAAIAECQLRIEETYNILKARLRSLYMYGTTSEIEALLEADTFETFLLSTQLINGISRHDTSIIEDIRSQVDDLNEQKARLDANIAALNEAKALLEEEKAGVEASQNELREARSDLEDTQSGIRENWEAVNSVINNLEEQSDALKALNEKAEAAKEELAAEIDALVRQRGSSGSGILFESGGTLLWPLQYSGTYISCYYGQNGHGGVDITMSGAYGKNISASASGTVIISGYHWSYGNYIVIDHGNGLSTYYAHASALYVSEGDSVSRGDVIGAVGSTGNSTGPHIHYEVRVNGSRRNPMNYLSQP
ncbi:MAG: peptidoglycan DD-metalloendopeptidase family protein [Clostridia bacterium]|nr:peptidoglycan DD-metalloendopeptidase family protein [Clostridia bacterium]